MILCTVGRHGESEKQEKEMKYLAASKPKRTETQREGKQEASSWRARLQALEGPRYEAYLIPIPPCLSRKVLMN